MTIEERVLEKLRELPPEKQKEVLNFVEFLKQKNGSAKPLRSLRGLWAELNINITDEDIAQARREMWGNFPQVGRDYLRRGDAAQHVPFYPNRNHFSNCHCCARCGSEYASVPDKESTVLQRLKPLTNAALRRA
jgi:hypothetical protein